MPRQVPYDDARLDTARRLAAAQGGVLSRPQLYGLGITRWEIRGQVRAHRWRLIGDQSVQLSNGDLSPTGEQWAADAAVVRGRDLPHRAPPDSTRYRRDPCSALGAQRPGGDIRPTARRAAAADHGGRLSAEDVMRMEHPLAPSV
ncbi:hypothetical protein [Nocardioides conyzicola]|uniref:Uncharacterized protein n=1 Tax=Nocardioides conyzicola TaxID=1651781 RepID=A0ABP8XXD3_9ACTN